MANGTESTSYTLPPQYIQDFLAGGGEGSGVAGLFPLLNQSMNQQFATMGQPGATPYTYAGERIAGFDPRELAGFELADQAIGSYAPYLNRQTDLSEAGLTTGLGGLQQQREYGTQALAKQQAGIGQAEALNRQGLGSQLAGYGQAEALNRQGLGSQLAGLQESGQRLRGLEGLQDAGFNQAQNLYGEAVGSIMQGADRGSRLAGQGAQRSLAGLGDATSTARGAYGLLGSQLGGSDLTARGTLQDAARTSLGAAREFDPASASRYMNPYEDQVVQQTLRDVREQGSIADQGRRAREIASGAFGGSRSRLQAGELAEAQRGAEMDAVSQLRRAGFGESLGQASTAFENQQRRQAGAASQLGNIAGGLGSLAGQQATAGQNLANQFANYGQAAGGTLANLGATETNLGQIRGGAQSGLGSAIQGLTGQRVGLGQNLATGVANLGQATGAAQQNLGNTLGNLGQQTGASYQNLGNTLGNLGQMGGSALNRLGSTFGQTGVQGGSLQQQTGNQMGAIGNNLGNLQRQDISLLGSVGGANRGMNQAANDLAYQNFVGQYNLPQNLLGQYSGISQGIAPLAGATGYNMTQAPSVDYLSSGLGGFMTAAGQTYGGAT